MTYDIVYDICKNCDIVGVWTSSCHFCIRYRIRYRMSHRMSKLRYRIPNMRYRIRYMKKLRYRRFFLLVLAIFVYDVVYDIVRHIVVFAEIVYDMVLFTSLLYDIARPYRIQCRHYTISHAYIDKNVRRYRTMSHAISRPTMWRTILLASGYSALPDGLYYIVTVLTPFPSVWHVQLPNVSGGSLVTSKNRNFKL